MVRSVVVPQAQTADGLGAGAGVIGFTLQDCTPGDDVADAVIPVSTYTASSCRVRIKAMDPVVPLEIDIRKNGASIFNTRPLLPVTSEVRTIYVFDDFAGGAPQINSDDDITIDVVQGNASWQA